MVSEPCTICLLYSANNRTEPLVLATQSFFSIDKKRTPLSSSISYILVHCIKCLPTVKYLCKSKLSFIDKHFCKAVNETKNHTINNVEGNYRCKYLQHGCWVPASSFWIIQYTSSSVQVCWNIFQLQIVST
jgi:hypothetical protein